MTVGYCRDLEIWVRSRSRSLKTVPFLYSLPYQLWPYLAVSTQYTNVTTSKTRTRQQRPRYA